MAVPVIARVTTISRVDVVEEVTVIPIVLFEFSSIEEIELIITSGAESFSVIVKVTLCVPDSTALPPDTPEIATIAVSFPSYSESSVMVNVFVPVVAPAAIVIVVPLTAE